MNSILDLPPLPDSFLLIGTPGAGKTTLAIQLAIAQNKTLGILDLDHNLSGPVRYLKSINADLSKVKVSDPYTSKDGKILDRLDRFERAMECLDEFISDPSIDFILVDSLTSLVEFVLDKVRKEAGGKTPPRIGDNRKILDGPLRMEDWGTFFGVMKKIIFTIKGSGKTTGMTCHVRPDKDEMLGITQYFIAVPGQTATIISGWFSEAWLVKAVTEGMGSNMKTSRTISTVGDRNSQPLGLKTSCALAAETKVDLNELKTKLSK